MPRDISHQVTEPGEATIDLDCKAAVAAWCEVYGITRADFSQIVQSVGASPEIVRLELMRKTSHPARSNWLRLLQTVLPRRIGW